VAGVDQAGASWTAAGRQPLLQGRSRRPIN
jgi:hypothetical protein